MKKQLDFKQYQELKKLGYVGGITIGELFEFLEEDWGFMNGDHMLHRLDDECWRIDKGDEIDNLCDCLWQEVKQILEQV